MNRTEVRRRREAERQRRRGKLLIISASLLAIVIVAIVLVIVLLPKSRLYKVPDVVGLTYEQALKKVESANLIIDINPQQDRHGVKDLKKHRVTKQEPEEETGAGKETIVTVTLEGVPGRGSSSGTVSSSQTGTQTTPPSSAPPTDTSPPATQATPPPPAALVSPIEGAPLYPFTRDASIACGQWPSGSQDYPYFSAPRDGNTRKHAGIDIYPKAGAGAPVKAMKDGTVLKVAPFYTRASGEVAYGMLIDHGDFVANYAEVKPPGLKAGERVKQGQAIGSISGTRQLHFEEYTPGTTDWTRGWYGERPANLLDPTEMILGL